MAHIATAALLVFVGWHCTCAAEDAHTRGGGTGGAIELTAVARTAKLAVLCRRWPAPLGQIAVEAMVRDHASTGMADQALARSAVEDGLAWALIDFKAAPMAACQTLEADAVLLAANVIAGRATPHGIERQTYGMH